MRMFVKSAGMAGPVVAGMVYGLLAGVAAAAPHELAWPAESNVTRPWTFWHWMGNAVDKTHIATELKTLSEAGFGGVLIVQIQDVKVPDAVRVPFLSPEWSDLMKFTIREARRLGMDVDMCPTTGWEWGGPWVTAKDAGSRIHFESFVLESGATHNGKVHDKRGDLLALMGFAADGTRQDLMNHVGEDGALHWTAPDGHGTWTVYAAVIGRGSCRVKFPTPDGDGWVANYLCAEAMTRHLDKFTEALAGFDKADWPRAWYDDSWEASMSWADHGFEEFQKRRGYDVRDHLPEISTPGLGDVAGNQWPPMPYLPGFRPHGPGEIARRVHRDFRLTIDDMMLDGFFKTAGAWARRHGSQLSCETIDHPGNIVDMAALCDLPFADVGGAGDWWYEGRKYNTGANFFTRYKVQASAAHIMGRPLVASETMTCWGLETTELVGPSFFRIPLKHVKEKMDLDMVGGVNHTMYHSITYSPPSARWPGRLFQAGTQMGPYNPYWPHLAELNRYVSRCQAFMQAGSPDVDLLFYYPNDDLFMQGRNSNVVFGAERQLFDAGYDVDYVTDRMLLDPDLFRVSRRRLVSPGGAHKAMVIGSCTYMEDATLQRIFDLAEAGATVAVIGGFPQDVPGLHRLDERRASLRALVNRFETSRKTSGPVAAMPIGSGRILQGDDIHALMKAAGVERESLVDTGLYYHRRRDKFGAIYFMANPPGNDVVHGWIPLGIPGRSAAIFDAMTGASGLAATRVQDGRLQVYLQMEPSESTIVRVFDKDVRGPAWTYAFPGPEAVPILGTWTVEFLSGGEVIPKPEQVTALSSWTTWAASPQFEALKYFSGIARYSITFDKPAGEAVEWHIDLGDVRNSARVMLNGTDLGTVVGAPNHRVRTRGLLKPTGNRLEVEVANLAVNRVARLDGQSIAWNVVPALFGSMPTFNGVMLESGLLGPVRLVPSTADWPEKP